MYNRWVIRFGSFIFSRRSDSILSVSLLLDALITNRMIELPLKTLEICFKKLFLTGRLLKNAFQTGLEHGIAN